MKYYGFRFDTCYRHYLLIWNKCHMYEQCLYGKNMICGLYRFFLQMQEEKTPFQ